MTSAPMFLKLIVAFLSCGVCMGLVAGIAAKDAVGFQIAGTCLVLAAILVVGWRVRQKSRENV